MIELKFKQPNYAGQVFLPQGSQRATLVYVAGFPYATGENTIIRWAVSKGFVVCFPQAPGTYDSSGRFSAGNYAKLLHQCIQDVNGEGLAGARANSTPIKLAPVAGLVSHSFGTLAATRVFCAFPSLEFLLMFAPLLDYSPSGSDVGVREDLSTQYDYVRHSRPHTFRLTRKDLFLADAHQHVAATPRTSNSLVHAFAGELDPDLDVEVLSNGFDKWSQDTFGSKVKARLHITPSGRHSISSILDSGALNVLERLLGS